jgi:hypothetical protein
MLLNCYPIISSFESSNDVDFSLLLGMDHIFQVLCRKVVLDYILSMVNTGRDILDFIMFFEQC